MTKPLDRENKHKRVKQARGHDADRMEDGSGSVQWTLSDLGERRPQPKEGG